MDQINHVRTLGPQGKGEPKFTGFYIKHATDFNLNLLDQTKLGSHFVISNDFALD